MLPFRMIRQWWGSNRGSTAIEFSLLSLPFIFILVGIMEISIMFASNSVLDGATQQAARLVRTGSIQQGGGDPESIFKEKLCDNASVLLDCSKFQVEVVEMDKFSDFSNYAATYDSEGNLDSRGFAPGGVNTVNLVRVFYRYQLATPLIGNLLATGPNRTRIMISTVVLQTEPYDISQVNNL
jgi:Flp pilus assembly protein TadG